MLLNYLLECHISMTFQKIQKNFRSLCTLVIKIHESCCSIFNELCFSLHCLAARSLFIIPLCRSFVKRFFKLFSSFFRPLGFRRPCGAALLQLRQYTTFFPACQPLFASFFGIFRFFLLSRNRHTTETALSIQSLSRFASAQLQYQATACPPRISS